MARASRKQRLPITRGAAGKAPTWTLSAKDWPTIEDAYGVVLDADMRAKITAIVDRYFEHEQFDRRAPLASEAINWLKGMESAIMAPMWAQSAAGGGGARRYAEEILANRLQAINCPSLSDFIEIALTIADEARASIEQIEGEDRKNSDEKKAWRVMVSSLWGLAFDHKLPTTLNGSADGRRSDFVRFILALQSTFGDVRSWHQDNSDTLLTEIKKAVINVRKMRLTLGNLNPAN